MSQFLYFVTQNDNKDLLRAELQLRFPELTPSFSQQGFLTYKNLGQSFTQAQVAQLQFAFAVNWGLSTEALTPDFIKAQLNSLQSSIALPPEAPSRAYLKIAEACDRLKIAANPNQNWLEFGSAPGGASYYLLQHFGKVIGVDPGEMAPICMEHPNFDYRPKAIQSLTDESFQKYPIHWISSDLNLNPLQAIPEVLRLASSHAPNLQGILMTVKLVKLEHVRVIPKFEYLFINAGYQRPYKLQLPSHKREFLLFATPTKP